MDFLSFDYHYDQESFIAMHGTQEHIINLIHSHTFIKYYMLNMLIHMCLLKNMQAFILILDRRYRMFHSWMLNLFHDCLKHYFFRSEYTKKSVS